MILDTCVVSEAMRTRPNERVRDWVESQDSRRLFITATVLGELAEGVARLPAGHRKTDLETWLDGLIGEGFLGRILPFDAEAALIYGELVAMACARGRPPQADDTQIAAVARQHGFIMVTRNVRDFEPFAVPVINPWDDDE